MYSKYTIPQNYSGNRFRQAELETEMKTHKPKPSYSSTKTSLSPTFQDALSSQFNANSTKKTSEDVCEIEENHLNDKSFIKEDQNITYSHDWDEQNDENAAVENQNSSNRQMSENDIFKDNEKKKGLGSFFDDALPLLGKLTSKINSEDLLLISLILLFMSEESKETKNLVLPLLLLFLYS